MIREMLGRIEAGRGGELKDDELPLPEQLPSAALPDLSKVPPLPAMPQAPGSSA